jgi:hypothetical protein
MRSHPAENFPRGDPEELVRVRVLEGSFRIGMPCRDADGALRETRNAVEGEYLEVPLHLAGDLVTRRLVEFL